MRVQGLGPRIWALGLRVERVQVFGFWRKDFQLRVWVSGFRVQDLASVLEEAVAGCCSGCGHRVWGLLFRV